MRAMTRVARAMAMATKRAIARKRVIASNNDNKTMATETMTTTTTLMATNTMTTMTTLMMMTKTTTKTAKTMVRRQRLAVAGGGRGGQ
jgi:hypothetical protein